MAQIQVVTVQLSLVVKSCVAIILAMVACAWPHYAAADNPKLNIYAAASLTEAVSELAAKYQTETALRLELIFASSSSLARNIEQGAPADIFLSANKAWIDHLDKEGLLVPDSKTPFAANTLVLLAPADTDWVVDTTSADSLTTNLKDRRLVICEPGSVPAGIYAAEVLKSLGIYKELESSMVFASDARNALALVSRGEVDAGMLYATDARIDANVRVVGHFSTDGHDGPIRYWAAAVGHTPSEGTDRFLDFLTQTGGQDVLKAFGFTPVQDPVK